MTEWNPAWIRMERLSQGLTVEALAKRAELPIGSVRSAERASESRFATVDRVLRALGFSSGEELARKWGKAR